MNKNVEIGYWLAKEFEGKGLMTKSCKVLVDYAFHESKLKRVQIRCATGNVKSCRIPERLGFRKEGLVLQAEYLYGRFVDLVVYGMTDIQWSRLDRFEESRGNHAGVNAKNVESIDAIIRALYECVTFEQNEKPDFIRFRSLCHPGAKFISPKTVQTEFAEVLYTEELVARFDNFIRETESGRKGFHEREIGRKTELFGSIAHVLSAYESRFSRNDVQPLARGINSVELLKDQGRWWVLSIAWEVERPGNPLSALFPA